MTLVSVAENLAVVVFLVFFVAITRWTFKERDEV